MALRSGRKSVHRLPEGFRQEDAATATVRLEFDAPRDALIVEGAAAKPVYLWITENEVEIRDAAHLWGKTTGDVQESIRAETDPKTRVAQIGVGGENQVLYANIIHDLTDAAGRAGLGALF